MMMNIIKKTGLFALTFFLYVQVQAQNVQTLSTDAFAAKVKELPAAVVLDVRTPEEFSKGHIPHATNIDWQNKLFKDKIAALDKEKPLLVYCLSGIRSGSAAAFLEKQGFKNIWTLGGGLIQWRAAGLEETVPETVKAGMTVAQYQSMVNTDKMVLVDFYADWCAPCKEMKPYLDKLSKNRKKDVLVIRINVDEEQALCKSLKIDALPVLKLYKQGTEVWANTGFIGEKEVLEVLK